jgi:site-specific recombinase XerD
MTTVTALRRAAGAMTLADASRRFLRRDAFEPTTRDAYGRTLTALVEAIGANADIAAVSTEQLEDDLLERWAGVAATTYNRHRAALLSFFGWCAERGWTAANPVALVRDDVVQTRGAPRPGLDPPGRLLRSVPVFS